MKQKHTKPKRGRPVNEGLRDDIVCMAGKLFGEAGFYATTMAQIAQALKISKLSLYSRFAGKEDLFQAVIQNKCESYMPGKLFADLVQLPVDEALYRVAIGLMNLLTSEAVTKMERMLAGADANSREALLTLFYESGPARFKAKLVTYFVHLHDKKEAVFPDPETAADMFSALVKGSGICMRAQMGIPPLATDADKSSYCRKMVTVFIAGHR
jgi:AcrR family transcriptional regulator